MGKILEFIKKRKKVKWVDQSGKGDLGDYLVLYQEPTAVKLMREPEYVAEFEGVLYVRYDLVKHD